MYIPDNLIQDMMEELKQIRKKYESEVCSSVRYEGIIFARGYTAALEKLIDNAESD